MLLGENLLLDLDLDWFVCEHHHCFWLNPWVVDLAVVPSKYEHDQNRIFFELTLNKDGSIFPEDIQDACFKTCSINFLFKSPFLNGLICLYGDTWKISQMSPCDLQLGQMSSQAEDCTYSLQ